VAHHPALLSFDPTFQSSSDHCVRCCVHEGLAVVVAVVVVVHSSVRRCVLAVVAAVILDDSAVLVSAVVEHG